MNGKPVFALVAIFIIWAIVSIALILNPVMIFRFLGRRNEPSMSDRVILFFRIVGVVNVMGTVDLAARYLR
jgi:hypothetical protein